MVQVPFLAKETIERDALALLTEFERARGQLIEAPIPIEDIVEKHLKLGVEFDDMHRWLGVPRPDEAADVLGAICFTNRRVIIDESLVPEENPRIEGRYRFTLAHEAGGHWRLHRPYFPSDDGQYWLFDEPPPPSVVCRTSQAKAPIEWQAEFYAACLLMPRALLRAAWAEETGGAGAKILRPRGRMEIPADADEPLATQLRTMWRRMDDDGLETYVRPIAQRFKVSPAAMRIRLEQLGLLHRETPRQRSLGLGRRPFFCGECEVSTVQTPRQTDQDGRHLGPQLRAAITCLEGLLVDGLRHGFFELTLHSEILPGGKRRLKIRAGKSHQFTIQEDDLPR